VKTDSVRVLLALVVAIALGLLIAATNDARLIGLAEPTRTTGRSVMHYGLPVVRSQTDA
jgi:hypothetical protein